MSKDVMERLAAANPVDVPAQNLDDPAARIHLQTIFASEQDPPNGRYSAQTATFPRRPVLRLALTAAAVATLIAAVIAFAGSGNPGPSVLAQAYAATNSAGVILHYTFSTYEPQTERGPGALVTELSSSAQVWATGDRSHLLEISTTRLTEGRRIKRVTEIATAPGRFTVYIQGPDTPRGVIIHLPATKTPCVGGLQNAIAPALTGCENPIDALRQLYRLKALHGAGTAKLDGRTVDVLSGSPDPPPHPAALQQTWRVTVLVDPRTFYPLEVKETQTERVRRHGERPASLTVISRFGRFERIPLTAGSRRLLVLDPHPGARVITRR